jgi:hypothetical protein
MSRTGEDDPYLPSAARLAVMHNAGWSGPMTLGFVERPVSSSEREMQTLYFYVGFFDQQMLVCRHTSRRPEFAYASSDARAARVCRGSGRTGGAEKRGWKPAGRLIRERRG